LSSSGSRSGDPGCGSASRCSAPWREQLDDLLLPGGGLVELAAQFGEPGVDALFEPVEASSGLLQLRPLVLSA